jgi:hypothetical protein
MAGVSTPMGASASAGSRLEITNIVEHRQAFLSDL